MKNVMEYEEFYRTDFGKYVLEKEAEYVVKEMHGTILSVGCGTGIIERELEKSGKVEIIGIDMDDDMLQIARKRITAIKGNAAWLPFASRRFDGVIFITSLEFIEEYRKAIREGYRVLKNEGKILAMMLNTKSKYFNEKERKGGYISRNLKNSTFKIEKQIEKYFEIEREYFLCTNMEESCDDDEKALYILKGIKT